MSAKPSVRPLPLSAASFVPPTAGGALQRHLDSRNSGAFKYDDDDGGVVDDDESSSSDDEEDDDDGELGAGTVRDRQSSHQQRQYGKGS